MNLRLRSVLGTPRMVALHYLRRLALRLEQPILNSSRLDGSRAFLVVVRYVIDSRAKRTASHQAGVVGLQQFGDCCNVPHSRIEPKIVAIRVKDHWHSVANSRGHCIRDCGQNRAAFHPTAAGFFQPSHNPANANSSPSFTSKQNGCLDAPLLANFINPSARNQAPAEL